MRMEDLIESGRRCDISANTIRRLCQLFPAAKVDDGLALLYIEQRRVAIHNPTGWLQAALRRGFTPPRRGRNESADVRQQRRELGERRAARLAEQYRCHDEAVLADRLARHPVIENPWFSRLPPEVQARMRQGRP